MKCTPAAHGLRNEMQETMDGGWKTEDTSFVTASP